MIILALIAFLTITITFAYIPSNYDERYCNARPEGSDTPEAWQYYEEHRRKRLEQTGHTDKPTYETLMDYIHDHTTASQCAAVMAKKEALFFCFFISIYLYFFMVTRSYYAEFKNLPKS